MYVIQACPFYFVFFFLSPSVRLIYHQNLSQDPADPSTFPTGPMIPLGATVPPNDQITQQQQLPPQRLSSSVRSLPTSPLSLSHNFLNSNAVAVPYASSSRSGPTDTAMIPMHPTSYGTPSTGNEHTLFTTTYQGPIQSQHDSSLYVISNVPYNQNRLQVPYGSSQRRSGGYTGAAEI